MNKLIDSIFWLILAAANIIALFVAENITEKIAPTIWIAAITVIFVIKTATHTILNALKEQSDKLETFK